MTVIAPTITAENAHVFREQLERVDPFAKRIHVDLMDGVFAPTSSLPIDQVWLPEGKTCEVHVMYKNPEEILDKLISLNPYMVVLHAESDCDITNLSKILKSKGIKTGVAVLPKTTIESIRGSLNFINQLLIFSGNLGHQGGSTADLTLLKKINEAKRINSDIEIAWDGGVNSENVKAIADAGVNVINVGGFIHNSQNAKYAYSSLVDLMAKPSEDKSL